MGWRCLGAKGTSFEIRLKTEEMLKSLGDSEDSCEVRQSTRCNNSSPTARRAVPMHHSSGKACQGRGSPSGRRVRRRLEIKIGYFARDKIEWGSEDMRMKQRFKMGGPGGMPWSHWGKLELHKEIQVLRERKSDSVRSRASDRRRDAHPVSQEEDRHCVGCIVSAKTQ
jgi:hypothetical protein